MFDHKRRWCHRIRSLRSQLSAFRLPRRPFVGKLDREQRQMCRFSAVSSRNVDMIWWIEWSKRLTPIATELGDSALRQTPRFFDISLKFNGRIRQITRTLSAISQCVVLPFTHTHAPRFRVCVSPALSRYVWIWLDCVMWSAPFSPSIFAFSCEK